MLAACTRTTAAQVTKGGDRLADARRHAQVQTVVRPGLRCRVATAALQIDVRIRRVLRRAAIVPPRPARAVWSPAIGL
jgi:hypothetical protein